ncbi:MAG: twin-arginine translocase subunit TatB [Alphaproteobacteria bacterium]|nr:twin-arginine translocase subunit TatB [Alphaproteobacteria bacterium]
MFFDIGWSELLVIGVVALVFIGPKDLPRALRVAGYWFRKARTLSREFQNSVDQMIREAELDEMRDQLKKATEFDINKEFQKTVDPTGELAESIKPPHIPDYFETTPPPTEPLASETASAVPATAEAAAGASAPADPEQPSLPFDTGAAAPASSPEKVPVHRDPDPPKP